MSDEAERIVAEYDRRAAEIPGERYSASEPGPLFIRQGIERRVLGELRRAGALPLGGKRVLDMGCGHGQWLADFETWGARRGDLAGIDLVPERVEESAARLPGADIRRSDAASLPFEDGAFDIVLQSMMFSSILDEGVRRAASAEMARVLAPSGLVLWYDFFVDNPRNRQVRGMRRSEVADLFPGFSLRWRRATLAPPLVRVLAPRAWPLASAFQALGILDTHAVAVLQRR
jgi:ubiquinone/menaquinone biosynthesis C-methylase UbiE